MELYYNKRVKYLANENCLEMGAGTKKTHTLGKTQEENKLEKEEADVNNARYGDLTHARRNVQTYMDTVRGFHYKLTRKRRSAKVRVGLLRR